MLDNNPSLERGVWVSLSETYRSAAWLSNIEGARTRCVVVGLFQWMSSHDGVRGFGSIVMLLFRSGMLWLSCVI